MIRAWLTSEHPTKEEEVPFMENILKNINSSNIRGPFALRDNEYIPCDLSCKEYYVAQFDIIDNRSEKSEAEK